MMTFKKELAELINKHSVDSDSNTPDWVLAEYFISCLISYELAVGARDKCKEA